MCPDRFEVGILDGWPGALAEQMLIPTRFAYAIPETVSLTSAAREWLADKGYEPAFGARPMARLVEQSIKKQLAELVLFGELKDGGTARVDVGPEGLVLTGEKLA